MKQLLLFSLLALLSLTSCRNKPPYISHKSTSNEIWETNQVFDYEVNIVDTTKSYSLSCCIRHSNSFPYPEIPIALTISGPFGDKATSQHLIRLTDEKGKFLGEGMGDVWDYCHPIGDIRFSQVGGYKFQIQQLMHNLPMIIDVGFEIKEQEK